MSIETRKFKMTLKGGKLPNNFEAVVNVEMTFDTVNDLQSMIDTCAGGMSTRVKLQSQLRNRTVSELRKLELTGLKTSFAEINSGGRTLTAKSYPDQLRELGWEKALIRLIEDLKCTEDQALEYLEKLGIQEPETED